MPRLRFALPAILTLAMLTPVSAASADDAPGLTQSATAALACLTETPVTGCATETEFVAGNGTIDVASFGDDTYVLRGFPNTAFQDNGLFRVRRQGDAYVVAQCFTLTPVPGCTQTGLISNATSIAVSDQRVYLATSFPHLGGTVGGVTVIPRNPATGALTAPTACRSSVATLAAPGCVTGDPIGSRASGIAVAPDGDGLFVTGATANGSTVLGYNLAPDGDLDTAPSCLASTATTGCSTSANVAEDAAVDTAGWIDFSDDGANVYVTTERGITTLDRDSADNTVAFASCLSNLPAADAACEAFPDELRFPVQIKHSENETYTAVTAEVSGPGGDSPGSVLLLERDLSDGALSLTSCLSSAATAGCTAYDDLNKPSGVAIDPDDAAVYVSGETSFFAARVLTLAISGSDLTVLPGTDGCLQAGAASATCAGGARGLDNAAGAITLSADRADVVVGSLDGVAFLTRSAIDPVDPEPPVLVTGVAQPKPAATTKLDKKRGFTVPVQCTGDTACSGKLTVASAGKIKVKPGKKAKVVTFATAPYAVPKGKTVVVKLKVSAANTKAIARLRKVKSVVSAKSKAGVVRKANTTLVGKKKKK